MVNFLFIISLLTTTISITFGNYTCGETPIKPNLTNKISNDIVGGVYAIPYSWPWQALLCYYGWNDKCSFECGGSIIAPGWIMTAGHCVEGDQDKPRLFGVEIGIYDESNNDETKKGYHKIKKIYLHPSYSSDPDPSWDIALLELEKEITFDDHVQPVCLPSYDRNVIKEPNKAWATGWGTTKEGGDISRKLKQVNVPFVSNKKCRRDYPGELKTEVMICAGKKGSDTCQGDSGGPLVVKSKSGKWYQYGITSFGYGCAEYRHPGIYSRVSKFCDFIKTTTKRNVTCGNPK